MEAVRKYLPLKMDLRRQVILRQPPPKMFYFEGGSIKVPPP
jgi:hypothetical protein